MKKIFYNAMSYDEGGWFICEARDWPYKHKTNKRWFIVHIPLDPRGMLVVNPDPEVQAEMQEVQEVRNQLKKELAQIAVELKLNIMDLEGVPYGDRVVEDVVLDAEDGKKLTEALLARGWVKCFIPIGP